MMSVPDHPWTPPYITDKVRSTKFLVICNFLASHGRKAFTKSWLKTWRKSDLDFQRWSPVCSSVAHFSGLSSGQFPISVSLEVIPTANSCLQFLNVFNYQKADDTNQPCSSAALSANVPQKNHKTQLCYYCLRSHWLNALTMRTYPPFMVHNGVTLYALAHRFLSSLGATLMNNGGVETERKPTPAIQ